MINILLVAAIMVVPNGPGVREGIPETIHSTQGEFPTIQVTEFQGIRTFYCPKTSLHSNSLQHFGYMTTPEYDPDKMPRFDPDNKCRLCRGSGKMMGKSKCKCIREQEKDWSGWRKFCKTYDITGECYIPKTWKEREKELKKSMKIKEKINKE